MPILFKDVFGIREDYSKGLFYKGHNTFLKENPLDPPNEYINQRKLNNTSLIKSNKNKSTSKHYSNNVNNNNNQNKDNKFYLDFTRKTMNDKDNNKLLSTRQPKKLEQKKINKTHVIIINKFSSNEKNNWEESNQVGCKIWINNKTGEVVNECPWNDSNSHLNHHDNNIAKVENEIAEGTGALVYKPDELEELFEYLDLHQQKK